MEILDTVKAEIVWRDLVAKGELATLREISKKADKLAEIKQVEFLEKRPHARKYAKETVYKKEFLRIRSSLAYQGIEESGWVYKTLLEKKQTSLFKMCKNLILVGSGLYPYSLFDMHKRFKHLNILGLEIDQRRTAVAKELIKHSPAKDSIKILTCDGNLFDYSWLGDEDLIFISCDVESKEMIKMMTEKSKAHIFVCAPYDKTWLKNLIRELKFVYSSGGIINLTDS
jgi:hypothetical protein